MHQLEGVKNELLNRDIDLEVLENKREDELIKGERGKIWLIILGYVLALGGIVVLSTALLACVVGGNFSGTIRTDKDGIKYEKYDDITRNNGKIIVGIAVFTTIIRIGFNLMTR
jgi:hypothetical protein